ncbi:hypothetical protein PROFUN_12316 [Planoprotostelium fungivorum]|uniref:HYDIN/VesB/CFA65-like Ig-like domain-containing protein n=1 Tax=Planoprotostelium fungivorum TaxID=1890364 RepID=A0A2P6N7V8_9EUKA|nr:hypothetical protein PROFUN_12316 [Planoprotostelium fungivorum]
MQGEDVITEDVLIPYRAASLTELLSHFPEPPQSPSAARTSSPLSASVDEGKKWDSSPDRPSMFSKFKKKTGHLFDSTGGKKMSSPLMTKPRSESDYGRASPELVVTDTTSPATATSSENQLRQVKSVENMDRPNRPTSSSSLPSVFRTRESFDSGSSLEETNQWQAKTPSVRSSVSPLGQSNNIAELTKATEENNFDLLQKAFRGQLTSSEEEEEVENILKELPNGELNTTLGRLHTTTDPIASPKVPRDNKGGKKLVDLSRLRQDLKSSPTIKLSTVVFDFGKIEKIGQRLTNELLLTNTGKDKAKFKFKGGSSLGQYDISFEPSEGEIKKKGSQNLWVTIVPKVEADLNAVCYVEVENGMTYYFVLRANRDRKLFGSPIDTLETVDELGLVVPVVLVELKEMLLKNISSQTQPQLFSNDVDSNELAGAKKELYRGNNWNKNPHVAARLLKMWFEELPVRVMDAIPSSVLADSSDGTKACQFIHKQLPEPNHAIISWLVNLLIDLRDMNGRDSSICGGWGKVLTTEAEESCNQFIQHMVEGGKIEPST